ncbi:MAG: butyrate kinase [Oscillospiraceae bacterium]|jgi:butyrate kinase|nr:butyrate kinase [Oscillospiraceae bacterium]
MKGKILVINPGSTSTKIAMFDEGHRQWGVSIPHSPEELAKYPAVYDQLDMRYQLVVQAAREQGETLDDLAAVVSRGGPFAPVKSGAYEVGEKMLYTMEHNPVDQHVSNTGAGIAWKIARPRGIKAYIYDSVTVDEMIPVARVTGLPEMSRRGQGHNLNMRAAAIAVCEKLRLDYYAVNILVAHLGGGITLSLHSRGRIVDMISDDEGPFSPERAGGLPGFQLVEACFSGQYDKKGFFKHIQRNGGLIAYFGTADIRDVEAMIARGNERAKLVYEAMALCVAKNLAKLSVVTDGAIDRIVLTGGIAYSKNFTDMVEKRVKFIAPVEVLPGENEMQALYEGAARVLTGAEQARQF